MASPNAYPRELRGRAVQVVAEGATGLLPGFAENGRLRAGRSLWA